MVDVVVDQKPMTRAPYDSDDIPAAVKARVAAVESMYSGSDGAAPPSDAQAPAQPGPASPAPGPSAPAEPVDENSETWKSRYMGLQGRFTSAQRTVGEQDQLIQQLGGELQQALERRPTQQPQPTSQEPYLTDEDVSNYGPELLDVTQRAALQAIAPKLQAVEQQNAELQRRLAIEARRRLDQAVEAAVPNFREIDRNPRWHRWLSGVDVLSSRVRQTLLNEAISSASAPRVISFFRGFLNEEVATGQIDPAPSSTSRPTPMAREPAVPLASLAAPGRARPATGGDAAAPSDKPVYTRPQVAKLYEQHRKGAYLGREAEWARQEADIFAAQREGRFRT